MEEAVRISKILSELGLCSRREADAYIEQGLVMLDGKVVTELGTRAYRSQKVELKKQAAVQQSSKATVILNKPVGYISHLDDDKAFRPAAGLIIQDNFQVSKQHSSRNPRFNTDGLAPAGRLDIDSSGLLVLTQDGRIAKTIIGEQSVIEKEYLVRVEGKLVNKGLELLRHGLSLDGARVGFVVSSEKDLNLIKSARNIKGVDVLNEVSWTPLDFIKTDSLIFSEESFKKLTGRFLAGAEG